MQRLAQIAKITWAELPASFLRIRLEPASDRGRRQRAQSIGYILVAPIDGNGRIDSVLWRLYHEFCGIIRLRPAAAVETAHLLRKSGRSWAFQFEGDHSENAISHDFITDRFILGDHVSIREESEFHIFEVVSIEPVGTSASSLSQNELSYISVSSS